MFIFTNGATTFGSVTHPFLVKKYNKLEPVKWDFLTNPLWLNLDLTDLRKSHRRIKNFTKKYRKS